VVLSGVKALAMLMLPSTMLSIQFYVSAIWCADNISRTVEWSVIPARLPSTRRRAFETIIFYASRHAMSVVGRHVTQFSPFGHSY